MFFDSQKLKKDFPIFAYYATQQQPLIYLDNAATTQKPQQVLDATQNYYTRYNANVYRGVHGLSERATSLYEEARDKVQGFINAAHREEVVFTSGTTDGVNYIANAWGRHNIKAGDEILVTQSEHHANLLPWLELAKKSGASLKYIPLSTTDYLLAADAADYVTPATKIVALTHCSNLLGDVWRPGQIEAVIQRARDFGAKTFIDAAQSAPHRTIDVQKLNVDFLVFSGHKMCGPTGVGVMYIKKELHNDVEPYQLGGAMVFSATYEEAVWQVAPQKFEAGTPPIAQVIGLGAAVDYLKASFTFDQLCEYEAMLCRYLLERLDAIEGIGIVGNRELLEKQGHLVTFNVAGVHAHDLAAYLNLRNVAVRAGHHCAQPLSNLLGLDSTVRISFYFYNTTDDIDLLMVELKSAIAALKNP